MESFFGFLDGFEQLRDAAAQKRRENRKMIPSSWSTRAFTVGGGAISLGSDRGLNRVSNSNRRVAIFAPKLPPIAPRTFERHDLHVTHVR